MAKGKTEKEIFDLLRARGLRKRVARDIASASAKANGRLPKPVRGALDDLGRLVGEVESRISGESKKRTEAAEKAARTRKRNAQKRSASAKKAAQTRAKSSGNGRGRSTSGGRSRSTSRSRSKA